MATVSPTNSTVDPTALPPSLQEILAIISPSVDTLILNTMFCSFLVPVAIALLVTSTHKWKTFIFSMNIAAIALGFAFGAFDIYFQRAITNLRSIDPKLAMSCRRLPPTRAHLEADRYDLWYPWSFDSRPSGSRLFVGIPLCRDEGYTSLMDAYDLGYSWTVAALTLDPTPLQPIAVHFVNKVQPVVQKGLQILEPMIEERKANMDEYGDDWCDKPTDILQAILDRTVPRKASNFHVAGRLFSIRFGATHIVIISLSHALHHVALNPEIVEHFRAEIRDVIGEGGWTWLAVGRLERLDSFLKESQRHACIVPLSMIRKAMADVWLQDGTFIPKGTLVAAAAGTTHLDDSLYPNPYTSDAFRLFRMRKADLETSSWHQFTASSHTYLPFGHGVHACPGRFYAAMQMKVILSYIIMNFDLQLSSNPRPRNLGLLFVPNRLGSGEILFRKRQTP